MDSEVILPDPQYALQGHKVIKVICAHATEVVIEVATETVKQPVGREAGEGDTNDVRFTAPAHNDSDSGYYYCDDERDDEQ